MRGVNTRSWGVRAAIVTRQKTYSRSGFAPLLLYWLITANVTRRQVAFR